MSGAQGKGLFKGVDMGWTIGFPVIFAIMAFQVLGIGATNCSCLWVTPQDSFQAAIDAAPPGSTLCLTEGTWEEHIVIRKPLTLRGQGPDRTVLRPSQSTPPTLWPVISVHELDICGPFSVVMEGVTVMGHLRDPEFGFLTFVGIEVVGRAHVLIANCHILAGTGVMLWKSGQALIFDSLIVGRERVRKEGVGIDLRGASQARIENTTIRHLGFGILAHDFSQVVVYRSTIEQAHMGVYVLDDAQAIVTFTTIDETDDGVVALDRGQVKVVNCTLTNNGIGIAILHHASAVVEGNVITGSKYPAVFISVHDPRVWFAGFVVGGRNVIPGPDGPNGNLSGPVSPDELAFLMTKEGGVYPHK